MSQEDDSQSSEKIEPAEGEEDKIVSDIDFGGDNKKDKEVEDSALNENDGVSGNQNEENNGETGDNTVEKSNGDKVEDDDEEDTTEDDDADDQDDKSKELDSNDEGTQGDDEADDDDEDDEERESQEDKVPELRPRHRMSPPFVSQFSEWSEDQETIDEAKSDPKKWILWAAEKNELETLRRLIDEDPDLVHARDEDAYTPLHRACYNNNVEVIKILLTSGADIGAKTGDNWEPIHCACKWDSVEAVSLLIQNGADINAISNGGVTPLHLAASNSAGRRTLELLLWQPQIDVSIKNEVGDTAYDIACRSGPFSKLFEMLDPSINVC